MPIGGGGRDPVGDSAFAEVVGGHFHLHLVANIQADVVLAHFARDMSEDRVAIDQFDPEEGAFEDLLHDSFHFNNFTCHNG